MKTRNLRSGALVTPGMVSQLLSGELDEMV